MKLSSRKSCVLSLAIAVGVIGASLPVQAHHAFTMFDSSKVVTMTGTVSKYSFQMPHVWFYVTVATEAGASQEWGFEMGSPNLAIRNGWGTKTLKAGDQVTVSFNPMRNGSKAGSVVNVVLPDGRTLWNSGKPPEKDAK